MDKRDATRLSNRTARNDANQVSFAKWAASWSITLLNFFVRYLIGP